VLVFAQPGDSMRFWTLFGASNQLLAALTLLTLAVWLRRTGRRHSFALAPMAFVMAITIWALVRIAWSSFDHAFAQLHAGAAFGVELANGVASVALLATSFVLIAAAAPRLRTPLPAAEPEAR
jgi:carbon starvation protein